MRLITRSDFDGLICAVLLKELGLLDSMKFVHPKDIQDGKVAVGPDDILANVPYAPGCGLWFDHHTSESVRLKNGVAFEGASEPLPSCARVIWNYYGGLDRFPERYTEMMAMVDKCDAAQFTLDDVLDPQGWVLLSFMMDPRTGLGRYRDYRISNYQLMEDLIEHIRAMSIDEILAHPDVMERLQRYSEHQEPFMAMLKMSAQTYNNALLLDLRGQEMIYVGNRFMEYALFPQCNISLRLSLDRGGKTTVFNLGHSILNRSSATDVGALMLRFGGGGHKAVGSCQVPNDQARAVLASILEEIVEPGPVADPGK